jgi:hypothetical protein
VGHRIGLVLEKRQTTIAAESRAEDASMLKNASDTFTSEELWRAAVAELMGAQQAYSRVEDNPAIPELLERSIWLRLWRAECQINDLFSRL